MSFRGGSRGGSRGGFGGGGRGGGGGFRGGRGGFSSFQQQGPPDQVYGTCSFLMRGSSSTDHPPIIH